MAIALLDVNVLLALAWPTHIHHDAAHGWFAENRGFGWATCAVTESGFARLSMQPAVVKVPVLFGDVMALLAQITASADHRFWPMEHDLAQMDEALKARVLGHQQLTDAVLLDLAIRNQGRLATLDRRVAGLLAGDSRLDSAVAIIPA